MSKRSSGRSRSSSVGLGARLAAFLIAVIVAFALCEIGVRFLYPTPPVPGREPQLTYQTSPDVGFLHVPNQLGWLDDGLATINSLGLRGTTPETPKPAGSIRVLAIGDSTTFGWGVGDQETYCAELERLLRHEFPGRRIEVINGGVAAYDLRHDARLLKYFAPRLQPDIVLVGLYWNDVPVEGLSPDGMAQGPGGDTALASVTGSAGTGTRTFRLANQPSRWNRILRSSRALFALRHAWLNMIAPTSAADNQVQWEMALLTGHQSPVVERAWLDVQSTLKDIRDFGVSQRFAVGVVTLPIRAQVEREYPHAEYQSRVATIAESLGVFAVDPLPELVQQSNHEDLFIPYDRVHFSASGNANIADAVFEALRHRPEFQPQPKAGE
jgi:lysophospholipase L1-like esterase